MLNAPLEPNRVPMSTYKNLKKKFEEADTFAKNLYGEYEFYKKQSQRVTIPKWMYYTLLSTQIITILILLIK